MRTLIRDPDGDTLHATRDEKGLWLEAQEMVGGEVLTVVDVGPLTPSQVADLRSVIGPAPRTIRLGRAIVWPVLAAGPSALLAGATWGQVVGPWAGATLMAATLMFTIIHAGD